MRKVISLLILLIGSHTVLGADPVWSVNASNFSYSMTVTAVLEVDCEELNTASNRLGAFVGADPRGSALSSVTFGDRQLVFLTVYSNAVAGETITFRIYNSATDAIVDVVSTLTFQDDATFGSPSNPRLMTNNNQPTDLDLDNASIMENNAGGDVIGNLTVSDLDGADTHTFSLVAGTGDSDNGAFSISSDELIIAGSANYESQESYSIRVRATDSNGCFVEDAFTITVLPFNDPPTDINLSASEVPENSEVGVVIGSLTSVDEDADETFTYALVTGTGDSDNDLFMIDDDQLKAVGPFNFESQQSHTIRIRTTDSGTGSFEKELSIDVTDVNEAPFDLSLSVSSIAENLAASTVIGDLSASDEDMGDEVTFTFSGSNTDQLNYFTISNNQLLSVISFNYEELNAYSIDVVATDLQGATAEMSFEITIVDANDAPTDLMLSTVEFLDDQPVGTEIGMLSVIDEDYADTFTYSLINSGTNDNASFDISGDRLISAEVFKAKRQDSYAVEIAVTDFAGASIAEPFTITITSLAGSVLPSIDLVTPNGDGINDTWFVQDVQNYSNFNVSIYDSSGGRIYFKKDNYDNSWNGRADNKNLPTGTYFYVLKSNANTGKSYSGTISLFN